MRRPEHHHAPKVLAQNVAQAIQQVISDRVRKWILESLIAILISSSPMVLIP